MIKVTSKCGAGRIRTCNAWQSSRLMRRTGWIRFTLMPSFHSIVTKSTKSCQRLPIPPRHLIEPCELHSGQGKRIKFTNTNITKKENLSVMPSSC